MTRGLVLGCLLLFLAGWLAPVPVQALGSTRAAALWRTEAFARSAVAQAEAGDMTAAAESLALAVEASGFIRDEGDRARARGFVAWVRARMGDAEGALAEALGIESESDRLITLLWLAAAYDASGEEVDLRRVLDPVREMIAERVSLGKPLKEDLVVFYFAWLEARIGNGQSVMALAERLERDSDWAALLIFTAGGQLAAGDWDGARRTIETLLGNLDPESPVWGDEDLLGLAAYAQALAGDAPGVYGWTAELEDIEDRALVLGLTAAGRAAAGDVEGTFEAARRTRAELDRGGWLGLDVRTLPSEDIGRLSLPTTARVQVRALAQDGPAARAGLRVDDVVLAFNDEELAGPVDLTRLTAALPAGTTATLTLWRSGTPRRMEVTLGRSRAKTEAPFFFGAEILATSAQAVALTRAGDSSAALDRARAIEDNRMRLLGSLVLAGALDVTGDRAGAKAAAEIALAARGPKPGDRKTSDVKWFGQPAVAHVLAGDLEAALAALADGDDERPVDAAVAWFRVLGRALTGKLTGLPASGLEFGTRIAIFENRPTRRIVRTELLAMMGDSPAALATAKGITDRHDRNLALQRIALVQAAAGDIAGAQVTAIGIANEALRDAALAEVDAIASGVPAPEVADATTAPTLAQVLAIADPYRRSRALGALARAQLAAAKRDAARETIALARAAAEAESAPFYRALALVRVAEALVAMDDMTAALEIVSLAHAAAGAIEVPPKEE
jgi:hypothetical protein